MRFRTKIVLCMVWLLALSFGIGGSLMIGSSFHASMEKEKNSARRSCQMLLNTLTVVDNFSSISDTLQKLEQGGNTEWNGLAVLSNGATVYRSGADLSGTVNGNTLRVRDKRILVSCTAATGLTEVQLLCSFDISRVYAQRDAQFRVYYWAFLLVVLAGAGLSFLLCTWLTAPLRALTRVSRELAGGNLSRRVRVRSGDEVGRLSSEFNAMADQLEKSMEEMKLSMERQEEFMGSFAHELKTPMTSIIGYADLLRSQDLPEQDRREAANYVFSEGKRLESLSLKLLDLLVLRKESMPMQRYSPKDLIETMAKEFRPLLKKQSITLSCRTEKGLCLLEPDLFKSLLYNLVDNARKAMDEGGTILIKQDFPEGGSCRIRVADNGRGMPKEALERITEAFYRVDKSRSRAQGGAGLGLSLCQRIVELHHGEIRFESREGTGTCVTVWLPAGGQEMASGAIPEGGKAAEEGPPPKGRTKGEVAP